MTEAVRTPERPVEPSGRSNPSLGPTGAEGPFYGPTGAYLKECGAALNIAALALADAARALTDLAEDVLGRVEDASGALTGKELRDVILEVLNVTSPTEPVHWRHLYATVERAGHRVGGREPTATFRTALSRMDEIEPVGNRTGVYRLKEET